MDHMRGETRSKMFTLVLVIGVVGLSSVSIITLTERKHIESHINDISSDLTHQKTGWLPSISGEPEYLMTSDQSLLELPEGLSTTDNVNINPATNLDQINTKVQAEHWFNWYADIRSIECKFRTRLGHSLDGGWDVCLAGPYRPQPGCLVYSFGINNEWSFDDAIANEYGCTVRAFDPSMNQGSHKRGKRILFYPYGLGAENKYNEMNWKMCTLGNITSMMGDSEVNLEEKTLKYNSPLPTKRVIDYLKIDIEFSEWASFLRMFEEGVLDRVKQLSFEAHTGFHFDDMPDSMWQEYLTVMKTLDELGFKKWYNHHNLETAYHSNDTDKKIYTYGTESGYININFLQNDRASQN